MRAVVECTLGDTPPPVELKSGWLCERWNSLPETGGLYDQDYQTIYLMSVTINIYNAVNRIRNLKGNQIHSLTENERKILRILMDNKLIFHA